MCVCVRVCVCCCFRCCVLQKRANRAGGYGNIDQAIPEIGPHISNNIYIVLNGFDWRSLTVDALSTKPTHAADMSTVDCSDSGAWIDAIDCHHRRRRRQARKRTTIATISRARSRVHAAHSIALRVQFIMYLCAVFVAFASIGPPLTYVSWRPCVCVQLRMRRDGGRETLPADRQIIARVRNVCFVHTTELSSRLSRARNFEYT